MGYGLDQRRKMDKNPLLIEELSLTAATEDHARTLLTWFDNLHDMTYWGGPGMVFPISCENFISLIRLHDLASFSLIDEDGSLHAFGQFYQRVGKNHFGRLVVSPDSRGLGVGKVLVNGLIDKAKTQQGMADSSLFVMADNTPAIALYQALGFCQTDYPESLTGILSECLYMVREER